LNGELDAGLVILPVPKDSLEVEPVLSEPVVAAVPEQHSLAFKKAVALQDLDELPLISLAKRLHPYCYEDIHLRCLQQGYQPRIAQEVSSFPEAMALVAEGIGFAFTRECYEPFCCRGIWHTYTTPLTQNNEDVKVVQELLRHANSRITLDLYAQAGMQEKRLAQSKLVDRVLRKDKALAYVDQIGP